MKKFLLIILVLFCGYGLMAQQEYFIYIQNEKTEPFYVQWQGKNHSSSANGYLILSKIKDSLIQISIGFPKNEHPVQYFDLPVHRKDAGYLLKNMGEKGFALFNLQTLQLIPATTKTDIGQSMKQGPINTNAFSVMLANVVNDSLILYANNLPEPEPIVSTEIMAAVKKKETPLLPADSVTKPLPLGVRDTLVSAKPALVYSSIDSAAKKENDIVVAPTVKADTSGIFSKKDSSMVASVISPVPEPALLKDTAMAIPVVPITKEVVVSTPPALDTKSITDNPPPPSAPVLEKSKQYTTIKQSKASLSNEAYQAVFLVTTNGITDTVDVLIERGLEAPTKSDALPELSTNNNPPTLPAHCSQLARDIDVDKLRVNLMNAPTADLKISTAVKALKEKCYEVRQLKALSELFEEEGARFQFFESAYPYTSNRTMFLQLKELLPTNYYKERLEALLLQ